jgi:Fic family protein/predicted transcriptional regulator
MPPLKIDPAQAVLEFIQQHPHSSSSEIHQALSEEMALATLKRMLRALQNSGLVQSVGQGKSTRYSLSLAYHLLYPIDSDQYFSKEIDERSIKPQFNFGLLQQVLPAVTLFQPAEKAQLDAAQQHFRRNIEALSATESQKEFERLAIDLSWKSSQIEGNTYSLLETERLLKEQQTAAGKSKAEAVMLLNHKYTLDFIMEYPDYIQPIRTACIEDLHSMLVRDLDVDRNLRRRRVGITGTNYQPLDNEFHIREALQMMCELIQQKADIFEKALLALLLISYIQPFADGNKRTARIVCNALLLHYGYCPISFRTVDALDYKKGMLIFYEQNNISAFKRIFIEQFMFATQTYF